MIAMLRGEVVDHGDQSVVIDTNGVGYEVFVPAALQARFPVGSREITLHVITHVREDAISLFGFVSGGSKELFTQLTSVSGIGPRLALSALSTMDESDLRTAILREDEKALSSISGVGKRTAQRMILELRDKVTPLPVAGGGRDGEDGSVTRSGTPTLMKDLALALENLGYSTRSIARVESELGHDFDEEADLQRLLVRALQLIRS